MSARYRVFLGAPSALALAEEYNSSSDRTTVPHALRWSTVSSNERSPSSTNSQHTTLRRTPLPPLLEPHELSCASQNISKIYWGAIDESEDDDGQEQNLTWIESWDHNCSTEITFELSMGQSNSSVLDNVGPNADRSVSLFKDVPDISRGTSFSSYRKEDNRSGIGESYVTESESSFAIFPNFHFNLHDIIPLSRLSVRKADLNMDLPIQKVSVLAAVLEISGLDVVRVKKGPAAGTEVAVISFVIGDHMGAIVKLTAWRKTAENFDGSDGSYPKIKKGDVVFFKDVIVVPGLTLSLSASPNLTSTHEICYRSLPTVPGDRRFTPNLKLGRSDAVVRQVANVVEWVTKMAGLPA